MWLWSCNHLVVPLETRKVPSFHVRPWAKTKFLGCSQGNLELHTLLRLQPYNTQERKSDARMAKLSWVKKMATQIKDARQHYFSVVTQWDSHENICFKKIISYINSVPERYENARKYVRQVCAPSMCASVNEP